MLENISQLLANLDQLKQIKTPWTEYALAVINGFLSEENLHEDCLQDNFKIDNQLKEPEIASCFTAGELYEALIVLRQRYLERISDLAPKIISAEKTFQSKLASFSPDDLQRSSNEIHNQKLELEKFKKRAEELIPKKDIELLKLAYHYASAVGKNTPDGKQAVNAIEAFLTHKMSKNFDRTVAFINAYESINAIAAMREKLLSLWERIITKTDYMDYKNKKLDISHLSSLTYINFDPTITKKHQIVSLEYKLIQLENYFNNELKCGREALTKLKTTLKKHEHDKSNPLLKTDKEKIASLLQNLTLSEKHLEAEENYIKQILVQKTANEHPRYTVKLK